MKMQFSVSKNQAGFYCLRDEHGDLIATFALHIEPDSQVVNLIAAAPDLLEALIDLRHFVLGFTPFIEAYSGYSDVMRNAELAIAKAKGGTNE